MAENIEITNYWPNDIMSISNQNRHIQLLVKKQKSFAAGIEELKANLEEKSKDIKDIYNNLSDDPTSEEEQKNVGKRIAKLTDCETKYGVALPLPNELVDSQSHSWDTNESYIGKGIKKIVVAVPGINADTAQGISAQMASASGLRAPLIDPGYFQQFSGTQPREFSFNWNLVPNNIQEAKQILKILYHLKKYTLPTSTVNGVSMLSPYLFDIIIGNAHINSIMNMNNVVCTNLSINYSAEGALQFFADGIPKYMTLSMSFVERFTVTSEFY